MGSSNIHAKKNEGLTRFDVETSKNWRLFNPNPP
jgi:hypothetical protein